MRFRFGTIIVAVALAASLSTGYAQPSKLAACRNKEAHRTFVSDSKHLMSITTEERQVLDELACIAASKHTDRLTRAGALAALFHLAENNETAQEHLLGIVTDENGDYTSISMAANLLKYVADAHARDVLFEQAIESGVGSSRGSPCFEVLLELGDARLFAWLQQCSNNPDKDQNTRQFCSNQAKWISIQATEASLLQYIRTGDTYGPSPGWAIVQALRKRIDRRLITEAVLAYLEKATKDGSGVGGKLESAVRTAWKYGLLRDENLESVAESERIRKLVTYFESLDPGVMRWPQWATLASRKRVEFYGLDEVEKADE